MWKLTSITCLKTNALKPEWNYLKKKIGTLLGSWKYENKNLKKNQVGAFKIVSCSKLMVLIKTRNPPNIGN